MEDRWHKYVWKVLLSLALCIILGHKICKIVGNPNVLRLLSNWRLVLSWNIFQTINKWRLFWIFLYVFINCRCLWHFYYQWCLLGRGFSWSVRFSSTIIIHHYPPLLSTISIHHYYQWCLLGRGFSWLVGFSSTIIIRHYPP